MSRLIEPCPFCGEEIPIIPTLGSEEEKTGVHPFNDCLLNGCNIALSNLDKWNRRNLSTGGKK